MTQHLKCFAGTDFLSSTLPEIVRSDLTTTYSNSKTCM